MDLASWQLIRFDCKNKGRNPTKDWQRVVELNAFFARSSNVLILRTYIQPALSVEDEEKKSFFMFASERERERSKIKISLYR